MSVKHKIVLAAGTGFLGQCIMRDFADKAVEFVILTRSPEKQGEENVRQVYWDGKTVGSWQTELEGAEAIINLAGRTVDCRYTAKNKKEIIDSRVDSTNAIGIAINRCTNPPKVWINAGSAAIYGDSGDAVMTEESPLADNFSADVCKQWEEAFNDMIAPLTRKVFLRIGMVLAEKGGVLAPFVRLANMGLCGKQGNGEQYISWIHHKDFTRAIAFAIENDDAEGTYNCTAPNPIPNAGFTAEIRKALDTPIGLHAAAWMVKLGAWLIGTEAELLLTGRRVVPKKLMDEGFIFQYLQINDALHEIVGKAGTQSEIKGYAGNY